MKTPEIKEQITSGGVFYRIEVFHRPNETYPTMMQTYIPHVDCPYERDQFDEKVLFWGVPNNGLTLEETEKFMKAVEVIKKIVEKPPATYVSSWETLCEEKI